MRVFLLTASIMLAAAAAQATEATEETTPLEFQFFNTTYRGLDSGLEPIREGALTITLTSPEHRLTVYSNRLSLQPLGDGRFAARMEIELDGEGRLIADIEGAGVQRRFVDDVTGKRQTVVATGDVAVETTPEGYLFTLERPGPAVTVEIRSGVAEQIISVCRAIALLPLFDLGCDRLEKGLSIVGIPMPEAGTRFLLLFEMLSEDERRVLAKRLGL